MPARLSLPANFQKPLYLWNRVIRDSTNDGLFTETLQIYSSMARYDVHGNSFTYPLVFKACAKIPSIRDGLKIHGRILRLGFQEDTFVQTSLIDMYSKCFQIASSRHVFDEMSLRSVVSWNAMISAYCRGPWMDEALILLKEMWVLGFEPSSSTFVSILSGDLRLASCIHSLILKNGCDEEESIENVLISMYAKCGDLTSSKMVFDMVTEKGILLWTSMIGGYVCSGYPVEALDLFRRLLKTDIRPNEVTIAIVLSACADLGSLSMGQEIEEYILLHGLVFDQRVQASLIHMYSKCGSIKKAREVFERVVDKDLAVWASMINSYAIHGMGKEAISLFHKMLRIEGLMPDSIVYTSILLACSHSGLVEDGLKYFKSMQKNFGIEPTVEHCTCLVDLLGRVGRLDLALDTIQQMAVGAQAWAWAPFLNACRIHGSIELGELAAAKLLEVSPGSSGNYVLMANLYTSLGKWKEAHMMRKLIASMGLVKECGWSQVEISGRFHIFSAGDQSYLQLVNIYKMLEKLNTTCLEASYTAEAVTVNNYL